MSEQRHENGQSQGPAAQAVSGPKDGAESLSEVKAGGTENSAPSKPASPKPRWPWTVAAVVVLLVVAGTQLNSKLRVASARTESIQCRSNLKTVCFAARGWAIDHNGRFPTNLLFMKEAFESPRALVMLACPLDKSNPLRSISNWSSFDPKDSSYELFSPGMADGDTAPFMRCKLHGYSVYQDFSVSEGGGVPR